MLGEGGGGVRFADFLIFLEYLMKMKKFGLSLRPNHFIFIRYLTTGGRERGSREPPEIPLDPPLFILHLVFRLIKPFLIVWN